MARENLISILDIGTNSVIMLLAKCSKTGEFSSLTEYIATTMLGENLSNGDDLSEVAMERTVAAISEMVDISKREKVDDLIVITSSVVRNATNRSSFLLECHRLLDIYPQVLSGKEEAKFVYKGVVSSLEIDEPIVLIDIGGCSSEIAYGFKDGMIGASSFDVGTIKIADMFKLHGVFNKRRKVSAQKHTIQKVVPFHNELALWLKGKEPRVFVSSGTGTSYAAVIKKEYIYDRDQVNQTTSDLKELNIWTKNLGKMTCEERLKIPGLVKERVDTLPVGLLILSTILKIFDLNKFSITTNGLREGVIKHYIENGYKL